MKRPLAVSGLTIFFVLLAVSFFNSIALILALCSASFVLFVISVINKKSRHSAFLPTVFMSVIAGCLLLLCCEKVIYEPAVSAIGTKVQVVAEAKEYPSLSSNKKRLYVVSKLKTADGKSIPGKVRISLPEKENYLCDFAHDIEPGDKISFVGTIYKIGSGNGEIENSFKSKKVFLGAYPTAKATLEKGNGKNPMYALLSLRQRLINLMLDSFDSETAGVLISVLMGDKSHLPSGIYDNFKNAGVAHIMAVSGLHLSVWLLFIMEIIKRSKYSERKAAIVLMGFVFLIMTFALFSGSVMRAGFMMLLYLLGFALRKDSDSLNSLGFAIIVSLIINPYFCINIGFVLSVLSTLSIIVFALPLSDLIQKKALLKIDNDKAKTVLASIITCVAISFCVSVFTLPVQIYSFGTIAIFSIASNLLFLPMTMPLVVCGGLYAAFHYVPLLSIILKLASKFVVGYCSGVAKLMGSRSFSVLSVEKEYAAVGLMITVVVCAIMAHTLSKRSIRAKRSISVLLAVFAIVSVFACGAYESKNTRLIVYDVDSGLCVALKQGKKQVFVGCNCSDYYESIIENSMSQEGMKTLRVVVPDAFDCNARLLLSLNPNSVICGENSDLLPPKLQSRMVEEKSFSLGEVTIELNEESVDIALFGNTIKITEENLLDINEKSVIILSDETKEKSDFSTAEYNTITAVFRKNGKFKIRGENSWRLLTKSS